MASGAIKAVASKADVETVIKGNSIGTFGSKSAFDSALDTLLASMRNDGVYTFQFNTNAEFLPFESGLTYVGTIYKSGSNTTFSHANISLISDTLTIVSRRNGDGWSHIKVPMNDNTFWQTSRADHILYVPSNTRSIVMVCGSGATRFGMWFVYSSGNGTVTTQEIFKGANVNASIPSGTSNRIQFNFDNNQGMAVRTINMYGNKILNIDDV